MICDYEGFKLAKLAQLRRLAETSNFQTAAEFRRLAKTIIDPIEMPEIHGDWYCYEIDQAARSAPNDALPKDRGIYMLTGDDYSWGRVGEGVLGERPLCSQIAYLIDSTDFAARRRQNGRSFWSITKSLVEAIDSNAVAFAGTSSPTISRNHKRNMARRQ